MSFHSPVRRPAGTSSPRRQGLRLSLLPVVAAVLGAAVLTWWPAEVAGPATLTSSHTARDGSAVVERPEGRHRAERGQADRARKAARAKPTRPASRPAPTVPATPSAATVQPPVTPPPPPPPPPAPAPLPPAPPPRDGLTGVTFYGPNHGAARAAAHPGVAPVDAALLTELARVPTATWLGQWSGDVAATVRRVVADAGAAGGVPVLVAYNIPGRDCGGYSAGGEGSAEGYARWVQGIAAGIGAGEAVVVLEPDALAQLCGDPAERYRMLREAVDVLERNPGTHTYLDAGHADWIDAPTMAGRLSTAGVAGADGFALNVSNFGTTAANVGYGRQVSSLLGGAHFVVDTSRNGNGPGSDWCNPSGRAVGERPTARTGDYLVDAFLWIKTPGESDGTCNGGPPAGVFWPEYAVGLMRAG